MTLIYLRKDIGALLVGSKDVGLVVNAERTVCAYMFVPCKQNA